MSYNKTISMGRLTRDPELETVGSGTNLCNINIAMDSGWGKNKRVCFIQVSTWGKQAEFVAKYFKKGDGIHIEGRLEQDLWKVKNTGEKRSKHRITAERVQFPLSAKSRENKQEIEDNFPTDDDSPGWVTNYDDIDEIPL